jgi:hypothetical protein
MAGRIVHPKHLAGQRASALAHADAATDPDVRENFERIAADAERRLREAERCLKCGAHLEDDESKERGYGSECWLRIQSTPAGALRGAPATTPYDPHENEEF